MAEQAKSERPAVPLPAKRTQPSPKPDLATLAGIVVALAGIVGGLLLENGSISDIAQGTAAMIVLGGTFGAVLITTPMSEAVGAARALREVLFEQSHSFEATIEEIIGYAGKARRHGIVSLEAEAEQEANPFLKKVLNLAVDGTDLQVLRHMMELEMNGSAHRYETEARVWEAAGGYAPTIGIIGAVLGLIQVMKHLENIKEVGHGIAVAFVATVYGVGAANVFFIPAASKLRARARQLGLLQELMLEGVIGIVEGLNPVLIRLKLQAFIGPGDARETGAPKPGTKEPAARGEGGKVAAA
jgi:chemotaxis protein MotA